MTERRKQTKSDLVREELLRQIRIGNFPRGAALPPERALAESLDASYMTVRKAVGQLVEADYLERQPGVGTFVRQNIPSRQLARILAIVVPAYGAPEHFDFMNHACRLAEKENYLPRPVFARSWDDRAILDAYQNCDAMISFCGDTNVMSPTIRNQLLDRSRPVVIIGSHAYLNGFDTVIGTPFVAINSLMDYLIDNGHRNIACVNQCLERDGIRYPADPQFYDSWFLRTRELLGGDAAEKLFIGVDVPEFEQPHRKIYEAIRKFGPNPPFTAVVSATSMVWGVIAALIDLGLRVPEDISVATVGDRQELEYYRPRLTHYSIPLRDHVEKALELIRLRLEHPAVPPLSRLIPERFIAGETVRNISESKIKKGVVL